MQMQGYMMGPGGQQYTNQVVRSPRSGGQYGGGNRGSYGGQQRQQQGRMSGGGTMSAAAGQRYQVGLKWKSIKVLIVNQI
jgi:hypothetical protein